MVRVRVIAILRGIDGEASLHHDFAMPFVPTIGLELSGLPAFDDSADVEHIYGWDVANGRLEVGIRVDEQCRPLDDMIRAYAGWRVSQDTRGCVMT